MKHCQICGVNIPERYDDRAKREKTTLICPICYHVVADYREQGES